MVAYVRSLASIAEARTGCEILRNAYKRVGPRRAIGHVGAITRYAFMNS